MEYENIIEFAWLCFDVCNHIRKLLTVKYVSKCGHGFPHGDETSGDTDPRLDKYIQIYIKK